MFAVANPDSVDSAVLDKVVRLTIALGAELDLFHCANGLLVPQPQRLGFFEDEHNVGEFIERRQQELEHRAQGLRRPGLQIRSSVTWDYPLHEGIVRQVLRHQPDLLIVQPSRHHGPWMLGYTDYKLIETCPCPLLLMKTTRQYLESCLIAAVDPMHEHDKPAALDDVILDAATVLSTALSGKLWLFHACAQWPQVKPPLSHQPAAVREDVEIVHNRGVEERVLELARRHGIARSDVELVEGHAVDALPFFARRESADVVAMGAVSRSLLKRIIIGHTAEALLDGLDCDMLIVKPPGFRSRVRLLPAGFPGPTSSAARP
jgi:universal stress protein E